MDRHFLEFWGHALLNTARGQKQLEELAKWLPRGFFNFQDFTTLFQKAYGLDQVEQDSPDYLKIWEQAEKTFLDSFHEYLNLLGAVPREEYAALAERYEKLKEKVVQQEDTIQHLKKLLEEKGMGFAVANLEFQELIKKQGDQFQELLKDFGEALKPVQDGN
jgi:tetratricopeptide (TPR) repeat protein